MATQHKAYLTPEAYLEQERAAPYKSEYFDGETFAMSGASRYHVRITSYLQASLYAQLTPKGCFIFSSDLRVHIPAFGLYTYPDVGVVCGEEHYLDGQQDTLLNPDLLIEVLSPSTEAYDRGKKFAYYQGLPSLKAYVLVAQDRPRIEIYRRTEGETWAYIPITEGTFKLAGATLDVEACYNGVEFPEVEPELPEKP